MNPFQIKSSATIPSLLQQLSCTLAISTYQAGKVIFISSGAEGKLVQLPRSFSRPMGLAIEGDRMAIACKDEVLLLRNSPQLGSHYPKKPGVYDAMYLPRITYHTGAVDVHDLDFVDGDLLAVNTNFSCIMKVDGEYSFTPIWWPSFIDKVQTGDLCHLNGMAVDGDEVRYVTAFATTNTPRGWTSDLMHTGVVIDYKSKELVSSDLAMPHSPRVYNNDLYLLLSGTGEFIKIDAATGKKEVLWQADRFLRGLAFHGPFAFIGFSKIRKGSSSFGKLKISSTANQAGVSVIDMRSGKNVGDLIYENSVDEIYDIQILPGLKRPSILNTLTDVHKAGLSLPDRTFWARNYEENS